MNFTQLSKYSLTIFANSTVRMSEFFLTVSEKVVKEYKTTMWIKEMEISRFMSHSQDIETEKLKEKAKSL